MDSQYFWNTTLPNAPQISYFNSYSKGYYYMYEILQLFTEYEKKKKKNPKFTWHMML